MAIPSSSTRSYDALLTTTLSNWLVKNAVDNIATANAFLNALITKPGGYVHLVIVRQFHCAMR